MGVLQANQMAEVGNAWTGEEEHDVLTLWLLAAGAVPAATDRTLLPLLPFRC